MQVTDNTNQINTGEYVYFQSYDVVKDDERTGRLGDSGFSNVVAVFVFDDVNCTWTIITQWSW